MEYIKNLFRGKDKKTLTNIVICFAVGCMLLILGNTVFESSKTGGSAEPESGNNANATNETDYAEVLEKRLAETLSLAAGAGEVRVMIKLAYGREIIVAQDTKTDISDTKEIDPEGGSREIRTEIRDGTHVLMPESGDPLVLKEIEPKIEGVIIVAEGGDDIFVKDALIRAAQTVLGVEPHKVQVLKMKGEK